jgi:hypothetical protein
MLVACRLAGLSALQAHYEGVKAYRQSGVEVDESDIELPALQDRATAQQSAVCFAVHPGNERSRRNGALRRSTVVDLQVCTFYSWAPARPCEPVLAPRPPTP